jgi:amino acid transporter
MEYISGLFNTFIEKMESIGKTSLVLYRYELMLKTSTLLACILYVFLISFCVLLASISFNIAMAQWVGRLLGDIVLGYLIVSLIYTLMIFFIYSIRVTIIAKIQNYLLLKIQPN